MAEAKGDRYAPGQTYELREHVGHDAAVLADPSHEKHPDSPTMPEMVDGEWFIPGLVLKVSPIMAGEIGTVEEVVPAGVAGGGPVEEETVVLRFGARRVSFTADQMATLFGKPTHGAA